MMYNESRGPPLLQHSFPVRSALFLLIAKLGTAGLGLVVVVAVNSLVWNFDAVPVTFATYRSVAQSIR